MEPLYTESGIPAILAPFASKEWIQRERIQAAANVKRFYRCTAIASQAFLNNILFFSAKNSEAIYKTDDGYAIDRGNLHALINGSLAGTLSVQISNTWQQSYFKAFWIGGNHSPGGIRAVRALLSSFGLFTFSPVKAGTTRQPPTLENIDFLRCLIYYEALENLLLSKPIAEDDDWRFGTIEDLPSHKGNSARMLFEEAFRGTTQYRRDPEDVGFIDENEAIAEAPEEPKHNPDKPSFVWFSKLKIEHWTEYFRFHLTRKKREKKRRDQRAQQELELVPAPS